MNAGHRWNSGTGILHVTGFCDWCRTARTIRVFCIFVANWRSFTIGMDLRVEIKYKQLEKIEFLLGKKVRNQNVFQNQYIESKI